MTAKYSKITPEGGLPLNNLPRTSNRFRDSLIFRIIIETTLVGLVYAALTVATLSGTSIPTPIGYQQLPQEFTRGPSRVVLFQPNASFAHYTNESNAAWAALMPKGRGFISVDTNNRQGLAPGIPMTKTTERYSLSAFHQIHCLAILREAFYQQQMPHKHQHRADGDEHEHAEHLDHCWDYLRQALMCIADPAVEPARVDENGDRHDTEGWGAEHQCRDWEHLKTYVTQNRAYEDDNLLGD